MKAINDAPALFDQIIGRFQRLQILKKADGIAYQYQYAACKKEIDIERQRPRWEFNQGKLSCIQCIEKIHVNNLTKRERCQISYGCNGTNPTRISVFAYGKNPLKQLK
ncbi:MAG: hypothetical protein V4805_05165 [Pseudomonadota bacterium]